MIRSSAARKALFQGLFSWAELQRLAAICDEEGEPLEFGVDVNAARYVGGRRETPNGEVRPPTWCRVAKNNNQREHTASPWLFECCMVRCDRTSAPERSCLPSAPPRWYRLRMLKP